MFYQLILSVAVAGLVINLIALFIIGKKKHRTMFHDLLIILTFSDVAVVICCALQFALPSLWQAYSRQAYPYILQYLLPFMHITVMVSVYTTILIRYRTFFKDLLFFIFAFPIVQLPMPGFEPRISVVVSDHSANCCHLTTG